jgi:predicted esterase
VVENQYNRESQEYKGVSLDYCAHFEPDANLPIVYLVHGRAGNFKVMWTFASMISSRVNIISPQAIFSDPVLPHSPNGFSWWLINDKSKSLKEHTIKAAHTLKEFCLEVEAKQQLSPTKRIALGFSQGGAVISVLSQLEVDFFSAIGLLASFVVEIDTNNNMQDFPVFFANGSQDNIVGIDKFERSKNYFTSKGCKIDFVIDEVGHKVGTKGMKSLKEWLSLQLNR